MPIPTKELVTNEFSFDQPGTVVQAARPIESLVHTEPIGVFERLATMPGMNVENLERLMQMYERAEAKKAEEAFNGAMSTAQQKMRRVATDANNPQTKSRYASYAALDRVIRPIYTESGFGLSFNTGEGAPAGWVRVQCEVTHSAGFAKHYHVDMPADGKGAKGGDVMTLTHAVGASLSYGMRYLLKMIFNVAVGEDDVDGNDPADQRERKPAPSGYQDWLDNITAVTDEGFPAFEKAWAASKLEYRNQLTKDEPLTLAKLKNKARQSGGGR